MPVLCDALLGGKSLESINDIIYSDGNKIKRNAPGKFPDLNELDFPAFELLPTKVREKAMFGYTTTRGCPFLCEFCLSAKSRARERKISLVAEDLKRMEEMLGYNVVYFGDLTFTINKKRVEEFCKMVKKESIDLFFKVNTRADTVNSEMIDMMSKNNFIEIN